AISISKSEDSAIPFPLLLHPIRPMPQRPPFLSDLSQDSLNKFPDQRFHIVDRDGEADALGWVDDQGVDADHFTQDVDERSSAVAGIDRRIGLNDVVISAVGDVQGTVFAADHAYGYGVIQAEGVAYRDHPFADGRRLRRA